MKKISVIIPSFNSSKCILDALKSCIEQTYKPHEVIVVDDGSSDGTVSFIRLHYGSDYVKIVPLSENRGPSYARNRGWDLATGDYVAFLDADDIWSAKKLELINEILGNHAEIDVLGHRFCAKSNIDDSSVQTGICKLQQIFFYQLLLKNFSATPCIIVRRTLPERFNENMRYCEDHELWLRMSSKHKVYFYEGVLTGLGRPALSNGGISENKTAMRTGEISMYFEVLKYRKSIIISMSFLILFSIAKHLWHYMQLVITGKHFIKLNIHR